MEYLTITCKMFLVIFLNFLTLSCAYNLDVRLPVVKTSPQNGSYFGFSVALHQIVDEGTDIVVNKGNLFLVGAPRTDLTVPNITNQGDVDTLVTDHGVVYQCGLSTYTSDCKRLVIPEAEVINFAENGEDPTGQWLGGVISSQGRGQKFVICAHRYSKPTKDVVGSSMWGFGRCFLLRNNLRLKEVANFCADLPTTQSYKEYGYCQSGTSAVITENERLILGAPGPFSWTGELFRRSYKRGERHSGWKTSAVRDGIPAVDSFSYLGMAVTYGRFDGSTMYYAGGAPRGNLTGEVVLFTESVTDKKLVHETNEILFGDEAMAGFGYSLLGVDINNDNYDDLIVGAPYYFKRHVKVGGVIYLYLGSEKGITRDTVPRRIISRSMTEEECEELDCTSSQFGYSLTKMGDVNRDGYQDIAVGAPYEGSGAVYIFHGGPNGLVEPYSQRIAATDIKRATLKGFGVSVSGGMDLDGNGYPDLAVGSYMSENAVLLRARPIIKLISDVSVEPEFIDPSSRTPCPYDNRITERCIKVHLCLGFSADPPEKFTDDIEIIYRIETEEFSNRVEFFHPTDVATPFYVERDSYISMATSRATCFNEFLILKKFFTDVIQPIKLGFAYRLKEPVYPILIPGAPLPSINDYPILDAEAGEGRADVKQVKFIKDCGDDNICNSDIKMDILILVDMDLTTGLPTLSLGKDKEMKIQVTLENLEEPAYEAQFHLEVPSMLEWRGLQDPKNAPVTCDPLHSKLDILTVLCPNVGSPFIKNDTKTFTILLDTSKLDYSVEMLHIKAWAQTTSTELYNANNEYSQMVKVVTRTDIYVNGNPSPEQVVYGGGVKGESAIKFAEEIGEQVNHTYIIVNRGLGTVPRSELRILWPYELTSDFEHGKHVLYLMDTPRAVQGAAASRVTCYVTNPDIVNPINLQSRGSSVGAVEYTIRNKRAVDDEEAASVETEVVDPAPATDSEAPAEISEPPTGSSRSNRQTKRKLVRLECDKQNVRCAEIKCKIGELYPEDDIYITVISRLWTSTFLLDYRNVDEVQIFSHAELIIEDVLNIEQGSKDNDKAFVKTSAIPDIAIAEPTEPIAWWLILIAVLGGILLLVLIILLLWKLGFFKRQKPEEVATHKASLEKKKSILLEDED